MLEELSTKQLIELYLDYNQDVKQVAKDNWHNDLFNTGTSFDEVTDILEQIENVLGYKQKTNEHTAVNSEIRNLQYYHNKGYHGHDNTSFFTRGVGNEYESEVGW